MKLRLFRFAGLAGAAAAAAAAAPSGHAQSTRGSVIIDPPVGASVTQGVLKQTNITVGLSGFGGFGAPGGTVASLAVPGSVTAAGPGGGSVEVPTLVAGGGGAALSVPPDTNISLDTSGAAGAPGAGGPLEGAMLILVQYN